MSPETDEPPQPKPWPGWGSFTVAALCLAWAGLNTIVTFATNDYRYPLTGPFFWAVGAGVVGVVGLIRRRRGSDRVLFGSLVLGALWVGVNCLSRGVVIVWPD